MGANGVNVDDDSMLEGAALAQCGGASTDEITAALEITTAFDQSVHELIICGGLTVRLVDAVFDMTTKLIEGASGKVPTGLEYLGDGVYLSKNESTEMRIWFTVGGDFSFAKIGELIPENLFESKSFFVGLDASGSITSPKLTFTAAGPLYELVKPGGVPTSPLKLSASDLTKLTKRWGKFGVHGEIKVKDAVDGIEVTYDVTLADTTISDLLSGSNVGYGVRSATAARVSIEQTLDVTTWNLSYDDSQGRLTGVIEGELRGGPADFDASWDYTASGYADIEVMCAE